MNLTALTDIELDRMSPDELGLLLFDDDVLQDPDLIKKIIGLGANVLMEQKSSLSIHEAARLGYRHAVQILLDAGVPVDVESGANLTPLECAAAWGHLDIIEVLLNAGANIHHKIPSGEQAIHWAAVNGHNDVVKMLLDHGVSPNTTDNMRVTPLIMAARSNHLEVCKTLIEHGANKDARAMCMIGPILRSTIALEQATDPEVIAYLSSL